MNKLIVSLMVAGTIALAVFVHLNPNPHRDDYQTFGVIHTDMHVEVPPLSYDGSNELHITKTGEWKAANAKPSEYWRSSHETQHISHVFRAKQNDDAVIEEAIKRIKAE